MSTFPRTRAFYQWFYPIYLTHFSKSIYLFMPLLVCIGKICCLCAFFMIVKIKYDQSAHSIWQQRIYSNYIRAILFISQQMRNDFFYIQFNPLGIFTLKESSHHAVSDKTSHSIYSHIVGNNRHICCVSHKHLLVPKTQKKTFCHFLRNKSRSSNTSSLIRVIGFHMIYSFLKRFDIII